jgi:CHAT domain-containing protein/Tfp pilus assembly protein PilF
VKGKSYCHRYATEEAFKNRAPEAGIIHLATHAIVDDRNPLYSKLVFANDESSREDGFLNTYELYNIRLNADLVVLSACNTGYGKLVRGEGIMSLARGFMYAGCPSIVMSLWPVDDLSTKRLMDHFYQGLASGLRKDEALRRAKIEYINEADNVKSNPFYWAGFVSIGSPDSVNLPSKINYTLWIIAFVVLVIATTLVYQKKKLNWQKIKKAISVGCVFILFIGLAYTPAPKMNAQTDQRISEADTTRANRYYLNAKRFLENSQFDSASTYYERASAIYEYAGANERVVRCYNEMGDTFRKKGDFEGAKKYLDRALETGRNKLGEDHLEVAHTYNNLGVLSYLQGDHDEALTYYHEALSIRLKRLNEDHTVIARMYNNMALIYGYIQGNYDKAIEFLEKSLSIQIKKYGEVHQEVGGIYNNIGNIYFLKQDYEKAVEFQEKSLTIKIELLGERHPDVATSYNNIGIIYEETELYDDAIAYYRKALNIILGTIGESTSTAAHFYSSLGSAYQKKGNAQNAIAFQQKALNIRLQVFGDKHPDVAVSYHELGEVFEQQNNFDKALDYYQKSIISLVVDFHDLDVYVNPRLENMSSTTKLLSALERKAHALENRYTEQSHDIQDIKASLSTFELATTLIDVMMRDYEAEEAKIFLREKTHNIYNKAVGAALELYELTHEGQYKEKAFTLVERSKAGILRQILLEYKAKEFAGIPDSLLDRERQFRIDLASFEKRLFDEKNKKVNADSSQIVLLQDKLFGLRRDYETLIHRFEIEYPNYYNLKYRLQTISPKEIQQRIIAENTVLVEYFIGDQTIVIFTIDQNHFNVTAVKKNAYFERNVRSMRTGLVERDYQQYTENAFRLYQLLMEPIASKIKGKNLIIIPDGILGYIPFEALITGRSDSMDEDYKKLSYLINNHRMYYSYSATLLHENMMSKQKSGKCRCMGFAPVVFQ